MPEVNHAIEILDSSNAVDVSNAEIGDLWERISKAIDHHICDDENHDAWTLELELSSIYQRNSTGVEICRA